MRFLEQLNKLKRIHLLIKRKGTGTPEKLAERLNSSRASIFRDIETLKKLGAPIKYDRDRPGYYYEDEGYEVKF